MHSLQCFYDLSVQPLASLSLLPCYFLDNLGWHLLNQHPLVYVFLSHISQASPVFHIASITLLGLFARLYLCAALSDPVPCLPSLGYGHLHDAMFSLGRRVWRHPLSRIFRSTFTTTSQVPGLSLSFTLPSVFFPYPFSFPVLILSCLRPVPVLIFVPVPIPVPVPVTAPCVLSLRPGSSLSTTSPDRRQILRPNFLATFKHQLLSMKMTPRAE